MNSSEENQARLDALMDQMHIEEELRVEELYDRLASPEWVIVDSLVINNRYDPDNENKVEAERCRIIAWLEENSISDYYLEIINYPYESDEFRFIIKCPNECDAMGIKLALE